MSEMTDHHHQLDCFKKTDLFVTNHVAGTSKINYSYDQVTIQKPKQQLMKTTNTGKTKPN